MLRTAQNHLRIIFQFQLEAIDVDYVSKLSELPT